MVYSDFHGKIFVLTDEISGGNLIRVNPETLEIEEEFSLPEVKGQLVDIAVTEEGVFYIVTLNPALAYRIVLTK